jgi:hypothetical protein
MNVVPAWIWRITKGDRSDLRTSVVPNLDGKVQNIESIGNASQMSRSVENVVVPVDGCRMQGLVCQDLTERE